MIHCEISFSFVPFPTPTSGKMNTYPLYLGQDINPATALHHTSMSGSSVSYNPLKYLVLETDRSVCHSWNLRFFTLGVEIRQTRLATRSI